LIGKPSPDVEAEAAMLQKHGIGLIVFRNSGGAGSYAKIAAARRLSLPVIMIERPDAPEGQIFATVDALMGTIA
ncbi:MAG: precorrin-6A/cobalt-precorrin-6A reductase, partial [Pseudomonadota bacterium]